MTQSALNRTKTSQTSSFKRLLFTVTVEGMSMWPKLVPGRHYLASKLKKPRIGSIIAFQNPKNFGQVFIKQVAAIDPAGYKVSGTVSWATGSQQLGLVPRELVLGTLL